MDDSPASVPPPRVRPDDMDISAWCSPIVRACYDFCPRWEWEPIGHPDGKWNWSAYIRGQPFYLVEPNHPLPIRAGDER